MLISHSHKFITIDIPKTGTRTLRETLLPLGIIDVVGGAPCKHKFEHHDTSFAIKQKFEKLGWDWDSYTKFSIIRDPWRQHISQMLYDLRKLEYDSFYKFYAAEDSYRARLLKIIHKNPAQISYLSSNINNGLLVDMIAYTDNLKEGFDEFCAKVGINPVPELKHINKGIYERDYREYYDIDLANRVADKENWVINYRRNNKNLPNFVTPCKSFKHY